MTDKKGLVTVLSGFSGAGKGTIMKHLLNRYPGKYHLSISATTRQKRPGEEDGREYFFKTREEFDRMIAEDAFLEHATFNGNSYGTPKAYVAGLIDEGRDVILEIEVKGALQVKKIFPDALLLFVTPPSAQELKNRLVGRGTETTEVVEQRLSISSEESLLIPQYDYLVINDNIEDAVTRVHDIIEAAHYATSTNTEQIKELQEELKAFSKGENK